MKITIMDLKLVFLGIAVLLAPSISGQDAKVSLDEEASQYRMFDEVGVDSWWEMVEAQPAAEQAWLNLFLAERFNRWGNEEKELSKKDKSVLDDVQTGIEFNVPNSFADNYVRFITSDFENKVALEAAEILRPNDPLILEARINYDRIFGSSTAQRLSVTNWGTQQVPSPQLLAYQRNVLKSLPQNALLITNGADDTYPLLLVQYQQNFRSDVKVIQLDLMTSSSYLSKVASLLGVSESKLSNESREASFKSIVEADLTNKVHLPFSLPGTWLKQLTSNHVVCGLSLSPMALIDLPQSNKALWGTMDQQNASSNNQYARNYIPMLLRIFQQGSSEEKQLVAPIIRDLASTSSNPQVILNMLSE